MITKTPAFQTTDGNTFATLEIAQRSELLKLVTDKNEVTDEQANLILNVIFQRLDEVKDILRCTGRRPRKAKTNNATRKRKASVSAAE